MTRAPAKGGLRRGLAGGVRREVDADDRALLAALRPDAQTRALLASLDARPADDRAAADAPPAADAGPTAPRAPAATAPAPAAPDAPPHAAPAERGTARPVELLPVGAIGPSPHQARRVFGNIDELAESILAGGLQHPVLVRRNPDGAPTPYTLVFGERRHRAFARLQGHEDAAVRARHAAVPAFVLAYQELSDARLAVLTAEENAQRAGLTAWELARNVVGLKAALEAEEGRPVTFERLGRHFGLQAGSTNEYYTIGTAFPEPVLRDAGLTRGGEPDWERVGALKKQRLLAIAKRPREEHVDLLRGYAGVDGPRRRQRSGARFTVEQLRAQGGFTLKIEKPVSSASYTRTQGESFLRDLEPALSLLAEIAGDGTAAYRPADPNLPGTYLVLRDRPERLSPAERRHALEVVDALRRELGHK